MSLKSSVYFRLQAQLNSKPRSQCSLATRLPCWTAQLYRHFMINKLRLNIRRHP